MQLLTCIADSYSRHGCSANKIPNHVCCCYVSVKLSSFYFRVSKLVKFLAKIGDTYSKEIVVLFEQTYIVIPCPKLYIPSTLNIDLILCHTQLIVCAENVKSWFKSWFFPFTFQAYILPHTLNCMCVSLFKFHI